MTTKINTPKVEHRLLKVLSNADNPVSIDYVRYNLKINWGTARALLLSMALEGKIQSMKTSKSWIFWVEKLEAQQNVK